jgi:aminopeptidase N
MINLATPTTVYLKDYTVPAFLIPQVELDIELFEDDAWVRATLNVKRNTEATDLTAPLQLNVDELTLEAVLLNGIALTPDQYTLDERQLTIPTVPDAFKLATVCRISTPNKIPNCWGYTPRARDFSVCVRQRVSDASPPFWTGQT